MANVSKITTTLHGLVNVIGGGRPCNIRDLDLDDWDFSLALNLTAPFHCLQLALPLLERAKGSVINFSSVAAYTGGAFGPHYASVKSGILGLTRSAARELGPYGIRVNAISPGPVDTEMTHSLPAEVLKKIIDETPLRRMVTTSEIASAVNYFLDEATSTTGQSLVIDGGRFFN
ncbi:3-oxoacyl-[acyl-carrier protein] reductase [Dickeya aquatica]|uniref:3-oxoacyl-[acyl-carrier protein] reductase n=2 Tax=Pectobacteriaceae TaxID=1903410 RepID=A0A375A9L5_9GAMM|nr:3-oxoacyl-[acyl-carrier protein] reductase [Dickeya aquatica]